MTKVKGTINGTIPAVCKIKALLWISLLSKPKHCPRHPHKQHVTHEQRKPYDLRETPKRPRRSCRTKVSRILTLALQFNLSEHSK